MLELSQIEAFIFDVDDTLLSNGTNAEGIGLHEHTRLKVMHVLGKQYGNQILLDSTLADSAEDFRRSPVHSIHAAAWQAYVRAGMLPDSGFDPTHHLIAEFVNLKEELHEDILRTQGREVPGAINFVSSLYTRGFAGRLAVASTANRRDIDVFFEMTNAARSYNKIMQVGTMNRSRPAIKEAIKFMQDGGIGKVYMARGLCFKPRPSIGKYPDGPMQPGEQYKLNVEATTFEPTYDAQYLSKVDYDMWLGPAPKRPFNRNRFHYNWHWHWDYGNGDTGNQGPHQFDIARWGLGKQEHPVKVMSIGGYFGGESSQETPDMQTVMFQYADGSILEFGTRGESTNDEGGVRIGNIFYGTKGWLWTEESGKIWQSYLGPAGAKNEKGPGSKAQTAEAVGLTTIEFPHYQNFIDAIRANDPKLLACDIMEGHLSSTLPHLANISYRVGHGLTFNGKTETFDNDKAADKLLTREYRKGFEIPALS